ncbi:MAG TPA: DUF3343 domain-containing protein [Syntrophorhabdaceae bacterium]|nr:DUF3343 domain-containing protein [Syntrophorhabdaceae bacterium]
MTEPQIEYLVALFKSVSHVISAERILKEAQVPHKIIPVPRKISSDCGVCIRFLPEHGDLLEKVLNGRAEAYTVECL